jgi:anti-anti-sigma factor
MAFSIDTEMKDSIAILTLEGELDAAAATEFRSAIEDAASKDPQRVVLILSGLTFMASAGLRVLVFAKQKMSSDVDLYVVGAHDAVLETITMTGFHHSVIMLDEYDAAEIESL